MNSSAVDSFIKLRLGSSEAGIIQVGHLQNTPLPKPTKEQRNKLNDLGRKAWAIQFQKLVSSEVSPYFLCMEAVKVGTHTLPTVLNEIDEVAREVYNVKPIDIQALVEQGNHFEYDSDDLNEQNLSNVVGILIQAIGTVFGRWDIRFATGERQPPKRPPTLPFEDRGQHEHRGGRGNGPRRQVLVHKIKRRTGYRDGEQPGHQRHAAPRRVRLSKTSPRDAPAGP